MRKCPVCGEQLVRVEYEGANAMTCSKCHGYLIDISSLDRIKRSELKTPLELKNEAKTQYTPNSEGTLKCPRCRMSMGKIHESLPGVELDLDHCDHCSLIWLDGGELALLQLGYEGTDKATEARRMKQVAAECESDPDRQAKFEKNLSKCKKDSDILSEAFVEGLGETTRGTRKYSDKGILYYIAKLILNVR